MSKAEEQKAEMKMRKQAIDKMVAIVFAAIQKHLKNCENKMSISIQTGANGRHRYFTVKRFKDVIKINIFDDGNVNVTLGEMVYGNIEVPLIRYEEVDDIDSVISEMKEYVALFFGAFFTGSMHELVSYINGGGTETEWKACLDSYKEYRKECDWSVRLL